MDKERHLSIVKQARTDRKKSKSPDENLLGEAKKNSQMFNDKEEQQVYINNFFIEEDNALLVKYFEANKNANKIAKDLNVPIDIVISKIFEVSIYGPVNTDPKEISEVQLLKDKNIFLKARNEALTNENSKLLQELNRVNSELENIKNKTEFTKWGNIWLFSQATLSLLKI